MTKTNIDSRKIQVFQSWKKRQKTSWGSAKAVIELNLLFWIIEICLTLYFRICRYSLIYLFWSSCFILLLSYFPGRVIGWVAWCVGRWLKLSRLKLSSTTNWILSWVGAVLGNNLFIKLITFVRHELSLNVMNCKTSKSKMIKTCIDG